MADQQHRPRDLTNEADDGLAVAVQAPQWVGRNPHGGPGTLEPVSDGSPARSVSKSSVNQYGGQRFTHAGLSHQATCQFMCVMPSAPCAPGVAGATALRF
ncbi:hypothetical protein GCM10022631_14230 [Deinococcus rubellus]